MSYKADTKAGQCVISGSPRKNGNSALAADLVHRVLLEEMALPGQLWHVQDYLVQPCISCGYCLSEPGACSLDLGLKSSNPLTPLKGTRDQALPLLRSLAAARTACIVSPIYFYHLPSQLKALLDRSQCVWHLPDQHKPGWGRPLGVVLIAGRPRGDKLFQGAMLSLRYFTSAMGLGLAEPLLLHGLDDADALRRRPDLQDRIKNYARSLFLAGKKENDAR